MAKIHINNPKQVINGGAKKYYFKVKGLGGPKGDKGDKGDTGSQGPQGPQGPQGNAATVSVGSTTTLPVGYDATVENVGTLYNAVLNFGIPQGPRGPQGATGAKGDKGDQGNPGPQGEKGTNATVYIGTTTTLNPGSQATVYNSGTDSNAVLNFGIPKGDKGDTGATGATGPQGPAGQDGQNFTPTVVDSLPATGEEGKLYLTPKAHTTSTATGNPIEATVTEQAGKIESFQLDGDTFQQSYTGKNLIAVTRTEPQTQNGVTCTWDGASFTLNGTSTAGIDFYGRGWWGATQYPIALPAGTYTLSMRKSDGSLATDANFSIDCYYGTTHIIGIYRSNSGAGYQTLTLDSDTQYSVLYLSLMSGKTYNNEKFYIQLEKSESPTTYEPYVGGQPSPNPSYPQDINVVTGTQTISINGTNYPLDLGDIQLCGLGDDGNGNPLYKDRIYRDGDDWKVHKELGNVTLDSTYYNSRYGTNSYGLTQFLVELGVSDYYDESGYVTMLSNSFTKQTTSFSNTQVQGFLPALDSNSHKLRAWIRISTTTADTTDQFKAWLNTNTPIFYYKLNTATDTTITDTTLIAQLEAIRTAALESGSNTISNTATGTNLAGDMEIGYYGFNPTNRYDKFIWLDLNNNYEQIGGE